MNEAAVQNHIRLDAAGLGAYLWRNNVGVLMDATGRPVRYGLANDSSKINKHIKSSDLIGLIPVTITEDMVGKTVGVFAAIEVKESGWVLNDKDEHALAQKRFHDIVKKAGGIAGFANSVEEFRKVLNNE